MPREQSDELKRNLRDEIPYKREKWNAGMVQPMVMLGLIEGSGTCGGIERIHASDETWLAV